MMAQRFTWNASQRSSLVVGSSLVVSDDQGSSRQKVRAILADRLVILRDGREVAVSLSRCDPSTMQQPPDPRQIQMFD